MCGVNFNALTSCNDEAILVFKNILLNAGVGLTNFPRIKERVIHIKTMALLCAICIGHFRSLFTLDFVQDNCLLSFAVLLLQLLSNTPRQPVLGIPRRGDGSKASNL